MSKRDWRVLLIDEREDWVLAVRETLRRVGYEVTTARDLDEAQAILDDRSDAFDLVLVDQIQGVRAKEKLHDLIWVAPDKRRRVIVFFVTDLSLAKMREFFKLGVYDCESKPHDPECVVKLVEKALGDTVGASMVACSPPIVTHC